MDAEVDLLTHNVRGNFRWWRPWAGLGGVVQVQQKPKKRKHGAKRLYGPDEIQGIVQNVLLAILLLF